MKKLTMIAALAMVACLSAFTFTGCGGSNTDSTTSDASAQESKKEESSKAEEASMVDGKYVSIEAFLSDPVLSESFKGEETDEYTIDIKAEGDSLVYEYVYKSPIEDVEAQKELLSGSTATDAMSSVMVNIANTIKDYISVENPSVITRYLNSDGTLIYEATYEADAE